MSTRDLSRVTITPFRAIFAVFCLAFLVLLAAPACAWVPPLHDNRAPDFRSGKWPEPEFRLPDRPGFSLYELPKPETKSQPDPGAQQPPPQAQKPKGGGDGWQVDVQGYRYLRMRRYGSAGNSTRFESAMGLFAYGSAFEQGTDMSLTASRDRYALTASFYEMPRQDREMEVALGAGLYNLRFGDIVLAFKGGSFTPFSKKITGFEVGYNTKKTFLQMFTSQSKSQTQTRTFTGRNIKGPYDLGANDLIPDRVTVKLNQTVLGGDEYILDAFLGEITFYEILTSSDVITVTFEQRLRGGLDAGGLSGLAAGFNAGRARYGVSHLVQEANRGAQTVKKTVSGETVVPDADGVLQAAHGFIARTQESGSETIIKSVAGLDTTLEPGVDYNAVDLSQKMAFYAQGKFKLKAPFDTNAVYTISYAYYPDDVVQRQENEYISHLNAVYTLQQQTIYYGSETVRQCTDQTCTVYTGLVLNRGTDYIIEESQNRIILYNYIAPDDHLAIDYNYYPLLGGVESTQYDHTVDGLSLEYDVSKAVKVKAEFARSQSDISSKPIQQLNETVAFVTQDLACSGAALNAGCKFRFSNKGLVDNSVVMYFNDRVTRENILTPYSDYIVDTDQGAVEIRKDIPAGTVILADYRYYPDRPEGLETGNIWQFDGAYRDSATQFALSLKGADTTFAPVGGEANMETARMNWNLTHALGPNLKIGARGLSVDTASDLEQAHTTTQQQHAFDVDWSLPDKKIKISTGLATRDQSDDFSPAQTDSSEKATRFSLGAPMPLLKNATMDFGFMRQSVNDNKQGAANTANTRRDLGINWKPSQNLSFNGSFSESALDSSGGAAEPFTSTTRANAITSTWKPTRLVTLGAKIDKQSKTDSRPSAEGSTINNTLIRLDTAPFGRVHFIGIVLTKNDRPSINTPSSSTQSESFSASLAVTRAIDFSPSYINTSSSYGSTSQNENTNTTYKLEYRPPGRPYNAAYSIDKGERSSRSLTSSSFFNTGRSKLEFGYNPNPVWAFTAALENETESSTSGVPGKNLDKLNLQLRHKPVKGRSHWLLFNRNNYGGTQSYSQSTLEFGLDYKLTDLFSWDLRYRKSDYSDKIRADSSYDGYLLESSLRIQF